MKSKTKKQQLYLEEVLRLRRENGYGETRISRILPVGHSTVSRWIANFAAENDVKPIRMPKSKKQIHKPIQSPSSIQQDSDSHFLRAEVSRLQAQLKHEKLRADAYDEMINVAESKFNIAIRKKVGAKR